MMLEILLLIGLSISFLCSIVCFVRSYIRINSCNICGQFGFRDSWCHDCKSLESACLEIDGDAWKVDADVWWSEDD